jgi:TonB-dependent siderophore receptor
MLMNLRYSPLAAALMLAISTPVLAAPTGDAPAEAGGQAKQLDTVEVHGERVRKASSPKYTEALVDTPQTITVVTSEVMAQQNLLGLRDVLSTLPGITFGAGEGGGGYGDSINLRGFTASSDITTDGVRDSAQYTRTDNFNLDAIELINGANSAMSGAGSVGGNINLVSKSAREGAFQTYTVGAGTDGYGRATADSNFSLDNGVAVRLNAMAHQNDAPGRDFEEFKRWGFAPSVAFGIGSDTRLTLSYFHQHDENLPQYGVPYYMNAFNKGPLPGVDTSNYYGYHNIDTQEIDVDMVTGLLERDFGSATTLRSLARFQKVDQLSVVDATQGTWCLANGINPATGATCTPAGTYQPSGPRGYSRDTSNAIAISQTDLTTRFSTGAVEHALITGVSFSRETFDLDVGSLLRTSAGVPATLPRMDLHNPDSTWTGPVNYTLTGRTEGTLSNQAVYMFDTLKFGERVSLNLGARYEHNEGDTATWNIKLYTAPTTGNPNPDNSGIGNVLGKGTTFRNEDDLFSYRAGLVFKPTDNSSIYLSYANAKTPSKASVNGACTVQTCDVDPETAVNIELGTKWDLLDNHLALTAALFRNERQNYKVADPINPLNPSGEQQLDGKARVQGLALGIAGNITREWSVFANYTYLDSEVLNGVSDYCAANPNNHLLNGAPVNVDNVNCANSTHFPDPLKGNPLTATPEHSANLWTTYQLGSWTLGYGVTYLGEIHLNNNVLPTTSPITNTTPAVLYKSPDYVTHRAMVGYQLNRRIGLQLNVNNLFDKEYYTRIRNNGWATPGDERSAVLTATFKF